MRSRLMILFSMLFVSSAALADTCATDVQTISRYPGLAEKVKALGGAREFIGKWQPESAAKRLIIPNATFRIEANGSERGYIFVQLEGHREVRLHVCDASDGETIAIKLINSPIEGVDTLYVRPVRDGAGKIQPARINLAAKIGSAKFKRIFPKYVPPAPPAKPSIFPSLINWGDHSAQPTRKPAPNQPAQAPAPTIRQRLRNAKDWVTSHLPGGD